MSLYVGDDRHSHLQYIMRAVDPGAVLVDPDDKLCQFYVTDKSLDLRYAWCIPWRQRRAVLCISYLKKETCMEGRLTDDLPPKSSGSWWRVASHDEVGSQTWS